ncbi:tryptophan synthase beta subunit-like PLP-dependent enzyme [Zopfochytrium polystomum]|nr:tryptophan synthase beta subunit-like PLP-dependent enzyme [Zopfochytrium polystomum]
MAQPNLNFDRCKILDTILDHIGGTPLVRINRIANPKVCIAKCEFFNAGGSVKDRIGKRMIEAAEKDGTLKPGHTIIEPTSGNTGIGLALAAAVKGYRAIITLPEKMSQEKVDVLKGLGAEIIRTPTEAAWDSPDSHIGEIPNSWIPDQYSNINNPLAHYEGTAEEILAQCGGKIDMFVASADQGALPECIIVGVDPHGSILALPEALNSEGIHSYKVEGIGYDFVPAVLDRSHVDEWVKTYDKESFVMARRLIREEGLLCGGSCGATMAAAVKVAKRLGPGKRCVVLLADSVRNYMTKFLNDEWMKRTKKEAEEKKLQWKGATIKDLNLPAAVSVPQTTPVRDAIKIMQEKGFDQLPVTATTSAKLVGIIGLGDALSKVASGRATLSDPVTQGMIKFSKAHTFKEVTAATPLESLDGFFDRNAFAIVTERGAAGEHIVKNVVTKVDLLGFLVKLQ